MKLCVQNITEVCTTSKLTAGSNTDMPKNCMLSYASRHVSVVSVANSVAFIVKDCQS